MSASDRSNPLVYLSIGLAALSLCTSLYQSYLFTQQVDLMQRNVARSETMRTCKELIEAYFDVKLKTAAVMRSAAREANSGAAMQAAAEMSAVNAVSRFAALGTYLANFQNEEVRYRYTTLSRTLEGIADAAGKTPPADRDKLFEPADKLFAAMNEDCVRSAKGLAFAPHSLLHPVVFLGSSCAGLSRASRLGRSCPTIEMAETSPAMTNLYPGKFARLE